MVRKARVKSRKQVQVVRLEQTEPIKIEISLEQVSKGQLYNRKNDIGWYMYQMTGGRRR